MRPGPPRGETATLEVTVTPDMTARVAGEEVHPVYGTAALVGHVEEVCRQLLVPHLEAGEEGVGAAIEVHHRAPVPVGETVTLVATVASVGPTTLVCEVLARHGGTLVARGSFEQRVVPLETFRAEVEARRRDGQPPASSSSGSRTSNLAPGAPST
jgi:fluoroacetyl-CoA thioesterase